MVFTFLTQVRSSASILKELRVSITTPPAENRRYAEAVFGLRRLMKTFTLGTGGKLILTLLPGVLKALRGGKGKEIDFFTLLKEAMRFGVFLGLFTSLFETLIIRLKGCTCRALAKNRAAVAGFIASTAILVLPQDDRRSLALFFGVRAGEVIFRYAALKNWIPTIPYGELAVVFLGAQELMSAVWYVPHYMDPSYLSFVHGIAGRRAKNYYPVVGKALECNSLDEVASIIPVNPGESLQQAICCSLHPEEGHFQHLWSLLKSSFRGSIGIYFPLYFLPMIVFRGSSFLRDPSSSLLSKRHPLSYTLTACLELVSSIVRSSLFLSVFTTTCFGAICAANNSKLLTGTGRLLTRVQGIGSLALIVEPYGRRIEVSLYILAQAILARCNQIVGTGKPVPYFGAVMFGMSTAVLMTAYVEEPLVLRQNYSRLVGLMFGSSTTRIKSPRSLYAEEPKRFDLSNMEA